MNNYEDQEVKFNTLFYTNNINTHHNDLKSKFDNNINTYKITSGELINTK